jgi:hypothetical protein
VIGLFAYNAVRHADGSDERTTHLEGVGVGVQEFDTRTHTHTHTHTLKMSKPVRDMISHVYVLNACSHAALTDQAKGRTNRSVAKPNTFLGQWFVSFSAQSK